MSQAGRLKLMRKPYVWCFTTYFAEGFPYSIIRSISSVFFRDRHVSLEGIGLTSLYGIPWIIKFLWGPQVDEYGTKRQWLLGMQGTLALFILAAALVSPLAAGTRLIALLFFAGAFIAATHDIAIDGYYLAALDKQGQTRFIGYRIMAYRMALMTGSGMIVFLGVKFGWLSGFLAAGLLLSLLFFYHLLFLPEPETVQRPWRTLWSGLTRATLLRCVVLLLVLALTAALLFWQRLPAAIKETFSFLNERNLARIISLLLFLSLLVLAAFRKSIRARLTRDRDSFYGRAFLSFLDQEKIGTILLFIVLVRAGEWMLTNMVGPFFVDLGIKIHISWISGIVGWGASIVGALLGGWLISRFSLKKMIWPLLLAQNLTHLVYMALALGLNRYVLLNTGSSHPLPLPLVSLMAVAGVHGFEQFASGLGNAVLVTYLIRVCKSEFKAAHYAIGSGLMSVTGVFAGIVSGIITAALGYGIFFGISFLASIPGMLLVFFIPKD